MKLNLKITAQILITTLILLFSSQYTFAGDFEGYSGVNGSVEIGVCGDGVVEGVEQCEPSVAVTNSCINLGYDKGDLTCDPSCTFNISECEYVAPTPILPHYPEIFEPVDNPVETPKILLPFFLQIYDVNGDGKVNNIEYCDGLTYWLKKWKLRLLNSSPEGDIKRIAGEKDTCDINFDNNCDLTDFSIFLHNK